MFIQTEPMPDVNRMKFYPGKPVLNSGAVEFTDENATERSPLANSLLKISGIDAITLYEEFITITKNEEYDWQILKPMLLGAIMDHYSSGQPALFDAIASTEESPFDINDRPEDAEVIVQIQELLELVLSPQQSRWVEV